MKRSLKILLTIAVVAVLSLLLIPGDVEASNSSDNSGLCGNDMKWSYDPSTKELVISGTGEMDNYDIYAFGLEYKSTAPWGRKTIDNVEIKGNVQTIGSYAFYNTSIKTITLPDSLKKIGVSAFKVCKNIEEIYIPGSVGTLVEQFGGNSSLKHVIIGEGMTSVNDFRDCKKLTTIELPESIEIIAGFDNCNQLVIDYGSYPNLNEIRIQNLPSMPKITIPDTCTIVVLEKLYDHSYALQEITLGKNVTSFKGPSTATNSLKNVYVDDDNQYYSSINGILYNKDQSELKHYPDARTDETYTVPDSVVKMCYIVNPNLKVLTIGKNVTEAGKFEGKSLEVLNVPSGLQEYSDYPSKIASVPTNYHSDDYIDGGIVLKYYSRYIDQVVVSPTSDGNYKVHIEFNGAVDYDYIRIGSEYNLEDVQQSEKNDFILSSDASWYKAVYLSLKTDSDESAPQWEKTDPPLITGQGLIAILGIAAIIILSLIGVTYIIIVIRG